MITRPPPETGGSQIGPQQAPGHRAQSANTHRKKERGNPNGRNGGSSKPFIIFAMVLWGIEAVVTMLIKDHKQTKRKRARERRRLEYQDRRMANDVEHAKVTRAMRYDVLRRDDFHCVRCGRGREDGVKLHVDHIVPVSRDGKSVMSNLQTLCEDCNCGKGNRYME